MIKANEIEFMTIRSVIAFFDKSLRLTDRINKTIEKHNKIRQSGNTINQSKREVKMSHIGSKPMSNSKSLPFNMSDMIIQVIMSVMIKSRTLVM